MSSKECTTLEGFITDCLFGHHTVLHTMLISRELERSYPDIREYIDYKINEDYDEDTQNWRDYRNSLCFIFDDIEPFVHDTLIKTDLVDLSFDLLFETYPKKKKETIHFVIKGLIGAEDDIAEHLIDNHKYYNDMSYETFYPIFLKWWVRHFRETLERL